MRRNHTALLIGAIIPIALFISYDAWQWFRHGSILIGDDGSVAAAMRWLRFPGSFAAALVTLCLYQNVHDYNGYFFRCAELLANGTFYGLIVWGLWHVAQSLRKRRESTNNT